jgi:hypothetical protein
MLIRTAMIVITTSSSTIVKPARNGWAVRVRRSRGAPACGRVHALQDRMV